MQGSESILQLRHPLAEAKTNPTLLQLLFSSIQPPTASLTCCYCTTRISELVVVLSVSERVASVILTADLDRSAMGDITPSSVRDDPSCLYVNQLSLAQQMNVSTTLFNPEAPPFTATPTSSNLCTNSKKSIATDSSHFHL